MKHLDSVINLFIYLMADFLVCLFRSFFLTSLLNSLYLQIISNDFYHAACLLFNFLAFTWWCFANLCSWSSLIMQLRWNELQKRGWNGIEINGSQSNSFPVTTMTWIKYFLQLSMHDSTEFSYFSLIFHWCQWIDISLNILCCISKRYLIFS